MPIRFDGRFESGQITTPASAGSGIPIIDTFFLSTTDEEGNPQGNNYSINNLSRVVDSPRWSGTKAFKQTIDYEHDYRPFNGGTLQKPRSALLMNRPEDIPLEVGKEYKLGFAFLLPSDFILEDNANNPDSLVQFLRASGGKPKHLAQILLVKDELVLGVDWRGGDPSNTQELTFAATRGVWHRFVFHIRPAKTVGQGGFFRIYKDGDASPVYEHTGINTDNDKHKAAFNLYKYAWHATQSGPGYNGPESDARKDYNYCMTVHPNPTNDTGRRTIYWDHIIIGEGSDVSFDDVSPLWSGGGGGGFAEITGMNNSNALQANADNVRFTAQNDDFSGVYKGTITDQLGNSQGIPMAIGQASSGRFNLGSLSGLVRGAGTVELSYQDPGYDSETASANDNGSIRDWSTFQCAVTPYDNGGDWPSTFGNAKAALIENTEAGSTGFATLPYSERISVNSGQKLTYRAIVKEGTSNQVFLRVQTDTNNKVQITGALGSLGAFSHTETGVNHVVRQYSLGGLHFIEIEFDTTETETYHAKLGLSSTGLGDNIIGIRVQMWDDRDSGALTVSHAVDIDVPDTLIPDLFDGQITEGANGFLTLSATAQKLSGDVYFIVTSSSTAPTGPQVVAGQDELGAAAVWAGDTPVTGQAVNIETTGISQYIDRYAYFVQVDSAGNMSPVIAAEDYLQAEVQPGTALKLVFDANNGLLKRNRSQTFTGTFDHLKLYDKDPLRFGTYHSGNTNGARLLAQVDTVNVVDGAVTIVEADLAFGSINQLSLGVPYWFYAFDTDKDPFAFGEKELIEE